MKEALKEVLVALGYLAAAALLLILGYWRRGRRMKAQDLGDGGVQTLFEKEKPK